MSGYTAGQVERAAGSMRVRSSDELEVERMLRAYAAAPRQQAERCPYCDNTGDVHSIDGEWRGECHECKAQQAERARVPAGYDRAWLTSLAQSLASGAQLLSTDWQQRGYKNAANLEAASAFIRAVLAAAPSQPEDAA